MTKISKKKPNTLPPMPAPLSAGTADIQNELGHAMEQLYLAIAKVDLLHDRVLILYSKDRPENVSYEFKWTDYLAWYISLMEPKEKDEALKNFSTKQLLKNLQDGEDSFTMDLSFLKPGGLTTWITIQAFMQYSSEEDAHAYIMVRRSGEKHLLKSIINQYVYNNCDYFIYLDAKNNSYTMFSHSTSGTPLPPSHCEDYSSELVKYARDFVVPEDQEMVIKEM